MRKKKRTKLTKWQQFQKAASKAKENGSSTNCKSVADKAEAYIKDAIKKGNKTEAQARTSVRKQMNGVSCSVKISGTGVSAKPKVKAKAKSKASGTSKRKTTKKKTTRRRTRK